MHEEIKTYLASQTDNTKLKKLFKSYITDKSVSLEERWSAFVQSKGVLSDNHRYSVDFDSLPEDFIMYDGPFSVERRETVSTVNIVEYVEEHQQLKEGDYGFGNRNHLEHMKVNLDQLKEEILESNLTSFQHDW